MLWRLTIEIEWRVISPTIFAVAPDSPSDVSWATRSQGCGRCFRSQRSRGGKTTMGRSSIPPFPPALEARRSLQKMSGIEHLMIAVVSTAFDDLRGHDTSPTRYGSEILFQRSRDACLELSFRLSSDGLVRLGGAADDSMQTLESTASALADCRCTAASTHLTSMPRWRIRGSSGDGRALVAGVDGSGEARVHRSDSIVTSKPPSRRRPARWATSPTP